MQTFSSAE